MYKKELEQLYAALNTIFTQGENTVIMGQCLSYLKKIIENIPYNEKEE